MSKEKYIVGIVYKANEIDRPLVTCKKFVKKELFDNLLRNAIKADSATLKLLEIEESFLIAGELQYVPQSKSMIERLNEAVEFVFNEWNVTGMKAILGDIYFERIVEDAG